MIVERTTNEVEFRFIEGGECFIDSYNNVYIKFSDTITVENGEKYNAVDVISGDVFHYFVNEMVTPVKAKLVI